MTVGSSMLAMILTAPPHLLRVSMSILKTRFSLCAQVIAARRSAGFGHRESTGPPTLTSSSGTPTASGALTMDWTA